MNTQALQALLITIAIRLGIVIPILLVGWWWGRLIRGRIRHYAPRTNLSQSMINLFGFVAYYRILLVAILISLAVIGVPLASTIASLGAILVVVGIALRTTLNDLAWPMPITATFVTSLPPSILGSESHTKCMDRRNGPDVRQ